MNSSSVESNVAAKEDSTMSDVDEDEQISAEAIQEEEKRNTDNGVMGRGKYSEKKKNRMLANRNFARASYQRRVRKLGVLQAKQRTLTKRNNELTAQNKQLRSQAQELRRQLCVPSSTSILDGGLLGSSGLDVAALLVGPSSSSLTPSVISGVHSHRAFPANSVLTLTQAANLPVLNQPRGLQFQNVLEDELTRELQRTLLLEQRLARLRDLPPGGR